MFLSNQCRWKRCSVIIRWNFTKYSILVPAAGSIAFASRRCPSQVVGRMAFPKEREGCVNQPYISSQDTLKRSLGDISRWSVRILCFHIFKETEIVTMLSYVQTFNFKPDFQNLKGFRWFDILFPKSGLNYNFF